MVLPTFFYVACSRKKKVISTYFIILLISYLVFIIQYLSDAEIRAEMALRNEKVNGESGEGEEDAPDDTIAEEEGEGGKGEASNEENGE